MIRKISKSTLCCFLATALLSSYVVESTPNIFDSDTTQVITANDGPEFSTRIVGGDQAAENQFPYFVQMGGCGGSLIASDIVLFAAHCAGLNFENQMAIGGIRKWKGQARWCEEILVDPMYGKSSESGIDYDFALCKLNRPVENFNKGKIKLVMNPSENFPVDNDPMTVMGYGLEGYQSSAGMTDDLMHVQVRYLNNNDCQKKYGQYAITDRMMCGGTKDGGKDACNGDSGGPIVKIDTDANGNEIHNHVGVVSWGVGCAWKEYPGVYARTSSRYTWIQNSMCHRLKSEDPICQELFDLPVPEKCPGQSTVSIILGEDNWAYETSWTIEDNKGKDLMKRQYRIINTPTQQDICLDYEKSFTWNIEDTYGDGVGPYKVEVDGVLKIQSGTCGCGGNTDCYKNDPDCFTAKTYTIQTGAEPEIADPSESPSGAPVESPSGAPSTNPSASPSLTPSSTPSSEPSETPSGAPSGIPSETPTDAGSQSPSASSAPSEVPSTSQEPSSTPSRSPSTSPSKAPSTSPSISPSSIPSSNPSQSPSDSPSGNPSEAPTGTPTSSPSDAPSGNPSEAPTGTPTSSPSDAPSRSPSVSPSDYPSGSPSVSPTKEPSASPSQNPTAFCVDDETYDGFKGTCEKIYKKIKDKLLKDEAKGKKEFDKICGVDDKELGFSVKNHWCRESCSKLWYGNSTNGYEDYDECFPGTNNPVTDPPVNTPVSETPVLDTPVSDTPVSDTPVSDNESVGTCSDVADHQVLGKKTCAENYNKLKKKLAQRWKDKDYEKFCEAEDDGHIVKNYWCRESCSKLWNFKIHGNFDNYSQCFELKSFASETAISSASKTPASNTASSTSSTTSGDREEFRWKDKANKTCQNWLLKDNGRKLVKKCNKSFNGKSIRDYWCPATCSGAGSR